MFKNRTKHNTGIVVIGAFMAAITLVGVFAAISDTANTGIFRIGSQEEATSINLKIAPDQNWDSSTDCSEVTGYVENQTALQLNVANQPEDSEFTRYVCLKNAGAQTAYLDLSMFDTTSTELGCTGDEEDFDATCGTGAGDLADDLVVTVKKRGLSDKTNVGCGGLNLVQSTTVFTGVKDSPTPIHMGGTGTWADKIGAGEFACFEVVTQYPDVNNAKMQANQSDQAEYKLKFFGDLTNS